MKRFPALLALTLLSGCGGSYSQPAGPSSPAPPPGAAADVTVTISGIAGAMSFTPAKATLIKGQTIAWKNNDVINHAIAQDGGGFSTSTIAPGATSGALAITTEGTLPYHCSIHPSMTGSLAVTQ